MKFTSKILISLGIYLLSLNSLNSQVVTGWTSLNGGFNGEVNAMIKFDTLLVAAGSFTYAGTTPVNRIALWNGTSWVAMGDGFNDTVFTLSLYQGILLAGGKFTQSGSTPVSRFAYWNGVNWAGVMGGANGEIRTMLAVNNDIYLGGSFTNVGGVTVSNIAKFDGTSTSPMGDGLNGKVLSIEQYNGSIFAGGQFTASGSNNVSKISRFNGNNWVPLGTGVNDEVYSLKNYSNKLFVGGRFTSAGGNNNIKYLASWNGSGWNAVGGGVDNEVNVMTVFLDDLVIGGQFLRVGSPDDSNYVNRIAKWNETSWSKLSTGSNNKVKALYTFNDSSLVAGGIFTTAGGRTSNFISIWKKLTTYSISGNVKYFGTPTPVTSGKVYAVRLDLYTKEILYLDSAAIQSDGFYQLPKVRIDSVFIIAYPNSTTTQDYIPTYHPSSPIWESASKFVLTHNETGKDIFVQPIQTIAGQPFTLSGKLHLNYLPYGYTTGSGMKFKAGSIISLKLSGVYKSFAISNRFEDYIVPNLANGNYDVTVTRLGFASKSANVTVNNSNIVNFTFNLDTSYNPTSVTYEPEIPEGFSLSQNYPNPFNPVTNIRFTIPVCKTCNGGLSNVRLAIFDLLGREVKVLLNENKQPGTYVVMFDASSLSSGTYFYTLESGDFTDTKKLVLIK